ncbi:hypothetical protein HYFRA_00003889 [Hymenoscyphus fraxineus]|uniref:Uncharacterized protein n=1 Tax=Hymenoscyphus fraxineus TaxID=746836 RepID=A0A9N9L3T2_9HELO|nr:hypothetical protein HYFRA_00003889 [Hymenoscyphus fraxineus]
MSLCGVRPEGFGPSSTLSSPLPTTCFTDTILIPLPTWLLLLSLPPLFLLTRRTLYPSHKSNSETKRSWTLTISIIAYYFLILVNILMLTLELVRLSMINFGVGLLPFEYIGLLVGAYLHFSNGIGGRIMGWRWSNTGVLWVGGLVVNVVKVVGLAKEGGVREGKYPLSDQITDVAVSAGVFGVIAILEGWLWVLGRRGNAERVGKEGMGSVCSGEEEMGLRVAPIGGVR